MTGDDDTLDLDLEIAMARIRTGAATNLECVPVRPGALLHDRILPRLGLPVSTVADRLGVTRQSLHRLLAGTAAVSPEMALRLGKFCGTGPEVWLRLQATYDVWHLERKLRPTLALIRTETAQTERAPSQRRPIERTPSGRPASDRSNDVSPLPIALRRPVQSFAHSIASG